MARFRSDAFDHYSNECAGSEVLACSGFGVLGIFLEETFVDFAFGIRAEHDPLGFVHHFNNAGEFGRVLDFVL